MYRLLYIGLIIFSSTLLGCSTQDDEMQAVEESGFMSHPLSLNQQLKVLKNKQQDYIIVASHRGDWQNYPENSIEAIQSAMDLGTEIIEIDIRITQDNYLVLMHDKELDRTTNGSGLVTHHTLEELKALKLRDKNGTITNYEIPTLEEALQLMKGKVLFFIDKAEEHTQQILQFLEETQTTNQAIFIQFETIETIQQRFGSSFNTINYIPGVHHSNPDLDNHVESFVEEVDAYAYWIKNQSNSVHQKLVEMNATRTQHIWISTTTNDQCAGHTDAISLNNPNLGWGWCLQQGASILMTDYPEQLITYLNINNKRNYN